MISIKYPYESLSKKGIYTETGLHRYLRCVHLNFFPKCLKYRSKFPSVCGPARRESLDLIDGLGFPSAFRQKNHSISLTISRVPRFRAHNKR